MNGGFDDLHQIVAECLAPIIDDPANRGRSWDQCCAFFQQYHNWSAEQRQANRELACLRLGFYLASWGMFRGSRHLLQKDYTIYGGIIDLLLADVYGGLWNANLFEDLLTQEQDIQLGDGQIGLLFQLAEAIRQYVNGLIIIRGPGESQENARCTNTIITKILLGTLACTPAYDTNSPRGLAVCGIGRCGSFTQECFTRLLNVCREHDLWQVLAGNPVEYYGTVYPIMRVIDLYFWYKGRPNS